MSLVVVNGVAGTVAILGLSSDAKPTSGFNAGSTFAETNTGAFFVWDGAGWRLKVPAAKMVKKSNDPAAFDYPGGDTVLDTYAPAAGRTCFLPVTWTLPGKLGDVSAVLQVSFDDASTYECVNSVAAPVTYTADELAALFSDGRYVVSVTILARNAGALQNRDLGQFDFLAWEQ